jgi:hypothetical protein
MILLTETNGFNMGLQCILWSKAMLPEAIRELVSEMC